MVNFSAVEENEIVNYFIKNSEASYRDTIQFLRKRRIVERPQKGLKEYLEKLRAETNDRNLERLDDFERNLERLPKDDTPPGASSFMSSFPHND